MTGLNTDAAAFERRRHFKFYTVLIVFFVSLGTCSYGTSAAIISTTLGQPSFFVAMGLNDSNMASLTGAMNSLYYAGGIFGAICHGLIADRYGRKWDIFVGSTFVLVSQALITGSVNPAMFIVFRFFAGWG
jgi:MFS family permease